VSDLPDRGRRLVDRCSDVGVGQVEDLAQDEDRPFGGREGLQHGQHRDRDALGELDVLGHVGTGEQRLGQPLPDVLLAPPRQRPQPVERLPGDDPDQVGPRVRTSARSTSAHRSQVSWTTSSASAAEPSIS
jgi:hypothetical protein